jgi:catechol 2,3-dioxygenase-like lactoylglutathione lyase family enzyme
LKIIINIDVPELAPAIAFYTAALGLTRARWRPAPGRKLPAFTGEVRAASASAILSATASASSSSTAAKPTRTDTAGRGSIP